jgi:hypothetical protein
VELIHQIHAADALTPKRKAVFHEEAAGWTPEPVSTFFEEEKSFLLLPGFESWAIQSVP